MEVERSSIIRRAACLIVNRIAQPNRWAICFSGALRAAFSLTEPLWDELQRRAQAGELTRATLVWAQGMAKWTPAGEVAELAPLFAHLPPPLPGA